MTQSDRIRQIRQQAFLTQVEFARELGTDPQTVSNWERGTKVPSVRNLRRIAAFANVPVADLLDGQRAA